jgi:MFS superfamily sulfate permease-like transporter
MAFGLALVALVGVLLFGVLPGLLVAVVLSLILLIQRLSRPAVVTLVRDPRTQTWGRAERHPGGTSPAEMLVAGVEGPLFFANGTVVKERLLELARSADPRPTGLVLDLTGNYELDLQTLDMLGELSDALAAEGVELRLAASHARAVSELQRSGIADRLDLAPTVDAAVSVDRPSS